MKKCAEAFWTLQQIVCVALFMRKLTLSHLEDYFEKGIQPELNPSLPQPMACVLVS